MTTGVAARRESALRTPRNLDAIHIGKIDVHEDEIGMDFSHDGERFDARRRCNRLQAQVGQEL
jgi:hypothetical protein